MTTRFTVTSYTTVDKFSSRVSIGDAVATEFDVSAWQEENDGNGVINSAVWTVLHGNASVSGQSISSDPGLLAALITYNQAGRVLISLVFGNGTMKKTVWLEVLVVDEQNNLTNDYGLETSQ